jgi:hypothetical protein
MKVTTNDSQLFLSPTNRTAGTPTHQPSNWLTTVRKLLSRLLERISERLEPQVSLRRDRSGAIVWQVYDPMTEQNSYFDSEDAVRVWLDQRYYA